MIPLQATKVYQVITPTDSATATLAGNLDCRDADYATIIVNADVELTTDAEPITVSLLQSDDTVVTNFATVVADVDLSLVSAAQQIYHVDMKGKKRYLRIKLTPGTVATDDAFAMEVTGILSRMHSEPASTSDGVNNGGVTVV